MKKKDFIDELLAYGQAFAVAFLLAVALAISMVLFLIGVAVVVWWHHIR